MVFPALDPTATDMVKVLSSDPAMGAPRLLPRFLNTVFSEVASPISRGSTVSTRRLMVDARVVARKNDGKVLTDDEHFENLPKTMWIGSSC